MNIENTTEKINERNTSLSFNQSKGNPKDEVISKIAQASIRNTGSNLSEETAVTKNSTRDTNSTTTQDYNGSLTDSPALSRSSSTSSDLSYKIAPEGSETPTPTATGPSSEISPAQSSNTPKKRKYSPIATASYTTYSTAFTIGLTLVAVGFLASPPGWFVAAATLGGVVTIGVGILAFSLVNLALGKAANDFLAYKGKTDEAKAFNDIANQEMHSTLNSTQEISPTPKFFDINQPIYISKIGMVDVPFIRKRIGKIFTTLVVSPLLDNTFLIRTGARALIGLTYKAFINNEFNVIQDVRIQSHREKIFKRINYNFQNKEKTNMTTKSVVDLIFGKPINRDQKESLKSATKAMSNTPALLPEDSFESNSLNNSYRAKESYSYGSVVSEESYDSNPSWSHKTSQGGSNQEALMNAVADGAWKVYPENE